ncbi:MAG: glycine betaine/L-proline ABC transporter ATP-binding protein, partial [Pseudomonadota bacterium]
PADPYIEDFVSDINRARVLRVGSIMQAPGDGPFDGDVAARANLEDLIALSGGDTARTYRVMDAGTPVGQLDMKDLVKALVPRISGAP